MSKKVEIVCCFCKNNFFAELAEVNRRRKSGSDVKFCSKKCNLDLRKENAIKSKQTSCKYCNCIFLKKKSEQIFCSKKCYSKGGNFNTFVKLTKEKQDELKQIKSNHAKKWIAENPDLFAKNLEKMSQAAFNSDNDRRSSKIERKLAEELCKINSNFKRHKFVRSGLKVNFDVDIYLDIDENNSIWIESDGEYHFEKVHKNHDFEKTQIRDSTEEEFVNNSNKNILLLRVKNFCHSLDDQVKFVIDSISNWDNKTKILKLY